MNFGTGIRFFLDENLPRRLARFLKELDYEIESVVKGSEDPAIIDSISVHGHRGVWLTQDLAARRDFRLKIMRANISVAWFRSGSDSKRKTAFMVTSFIYQYQSLLLNAAKPLYFDVREREFGGIPRLRVQTSASI